MASLIRNRRIAAMVLELELNLDLDLRLYGKNQRLIGREERRESWSLERLEHFCLLFSRLIGSLSLIPISMLVDSIARVASYMD
jgi:hypothetical protein